MTPEPFVVSPKEYPRPLNVVGEHITVLASAAATAGYEIFLQRGPEGSGPPPHSHPWDESFYVMAGEIEFGFDAHEQTVAAGTLVHIPGGTTHWFRFGDGGGQMISIASRFGAAEMFTEIDREIAPDRPDLEKLVAVAARHGLHVAAPREHRGGDLVPTGVAAASTSP